MEVKNYHQDAIEHEGVDPNKLPGALKSKIGLWNGRAKKIGANGSDAAVEGLNAASAQIADEIESLVKADPEKYMLAEEPPAPEPKAEPKPEPAPAPAPAPVAVVEPTPPPAPPAPPAPKKGIFEELGDDYL